MAELFVPQIIRRLSDVAFEKVGERVNLVMGVNEEVKNLDSKLRTIKNVLHDAERRKLKEKGVDEWLEKLEDIIYEMEDVLDEWNIKIDKPRNLDQGAQVKVSRMPTLLEKVRSLISSLCSCLKEVPVRSEIALKINGINDNLDKLLEEENKFNFVRTHSAHVDSNTFKRLMTTSIFDELEVHGRDYDKKILFEHLLSESTASTSKEVEKDGVKVISIVGAGGSGKTTLAQMLFNDERVQKHFDLSKWVCVSDSFDEKRIAKALLEKEGQEKSNKYDLELETLLQNIKITFSGKRFLLVLDDVWTEKDAHWEPFKNSLKNGAPGSIILVTTRKDKVVRLVGTTYTHTLGLMSDSECWSILKHKALSGRSQFGQRVETIGRKIAGKCKGLPLAAKVMGSLLRLKDTVEEWNEVLNSKIWQMNEASVSLFPHFYLSYNELSPQLKRCFSYCAVFPKDTVIVVEELIRLWMAQGYLGPQSETGHDRLNVIGRDYFKNLAMHSFFQEFNRHVDENVITSCKMHDIVHDFAQFLTKNECRAFDEVDCQRVEANGGYLCKERVRHLTLLGKAKSISSSVVVDIGNVRSLLFINSDNELLPQDLCSSLKSVRSLILSGCGLQELPPEIVSLIHLRCLDVSGNRSLKELPETVCDLHFLESLDVSSCEELELPQRIGDLVHLRYLLNQFTKKVKEMPRGLEKLTWLWNLGMFVADGTPLNNLGKLEHLNQLEQLGIFVRGHVDFESAQLGKKINLRILELGFEGDGLDRESIEMMERPPNLQQLQFWRYPRSQLPKWIVRAEPLINNLTVLTVSDGEIFSLPALGKLSSLQYFELFNLRKLKYIGREFYGLSDDGHCDDDFKTVVFPSLRNLSMSYVRNWERWEDISEGDEEKIKNGAVSIMPRLEGLQIRECGSLEALPNWLIGKSSSLKELKVLQCQRLREKYPADKNGGDWMKISHIPTILIK